MSSNLYDVLGVQKNATADEVRKAYKKRALQTHPDRLPQGYTAEQKAQAEEQFRLVNNAYEVLNDTRNRELYDRHGVWPPPTAPEVTPNFRSTYDSFTSDPFFQTPFGSGSNRRPFAFSDPFELFNSIFGDIHRHFDDDPFFGGGGFPSNSRSPFGNGFPFGPNAYDHPFGGSLFGPSLGFQSLFDDMPGHDFQSGENRRVYSNSTSTFGSNGRWVSQSQMTRSINGRTETIIKRRDAQGNEHITYRSPEGERYTINGVDQPAGALPGGQSNAPPPAVTAPLPQITANPYNTSQSYSVPIHDSYHTQPPPYASRPGSHSHSRYNTSYAPPNVNQATPPPPQPPTKQPSIPDQHITNPNKRSSRSEHRERAATMEREKGPQIPVSSSKDKDIDHDRGRHSSLRRSRHDSTAGSHHSHVSSQHHQPEKIIVRDRDYAYPPDHDRTPHRRHTHTSGHHAPPVSPTRSHGSGKKWYNDGWLGKVASWFGHGHHPQHSSH